MIDAPLSVVVVSRARPQALCRCLTSLTRQTHDNFEIIVVADPQGLAAVAALPFARNLKTVAYDEANISVARNLGIAQAGGAVIAFIDDDAVAEPTWARFLVGAFVHPEVAMAGGYVIGRNGISFQYRAERVDSLGDTHPVAHRGQEMLVAAGSREGVLKTHGTNCAFRRAALLEVGGFDPAFRFFHDETDLAMRLARRGHSAALVPLAQVHHGFAASERRKGSRMPTDLFEVGASTVLFLRRHAPETTRFEPVLSAHVAAQRRRLVRHMVAGSCAPGDVAPVLDSFRRGLAAGQERALGKEQPLPVAGVAFLRFPTVTPRRDVVVAGGWLARRTLRAQAAALAAKGDSVSLFLLHLSPKRHRIRYTRAGFWEQTGGVWSRSERAHSPEKVMKPTARVKMEVDRVAVVRNLTDDLGN
ncbi:putative glycosyl transferase [Aquimixticola soesokkakensis]|uniref:Putative glycosyl transferase n=1 Tax=Aquimixticola soesokkakensis TaxID=1519096 RepID=A0A1Y5R826_9RHOB|nr:glycosyltransferase [Aquimixticola soesokkakensis]SLN10658.1 putative glycosyl transferase [Aquimixticola soesokkakensis]